MSPTLAILTRIADRSGSTGAAGSGSGGGAGGTGAGSGAGPALCPSLSQPGHGSGPDSSQDPPEFALALLQADRRVWDVTSAGAAAASARPRGRSILRAAGRQDPLNVGNRTTTCGVAGPEDA